MDRKRYEPVWNVFSVDKWRCSVARFTDSQATECEGVPAPENCQKDYDRRMRNAYAMSNYAEAKEALQKIFRQLETINPNAAQSLEEGLEETLTVHRLGIGAVLRRKLATTKPIESCLSTVQRVARNVGHPPIRGIFVVPSLSLL
jgi:hypothetical protein